tara:strand:- start:355 stop:561 length:207 start_codon:yes stop_codon:yes gene_type:complete
MNKLIELKSVGSMLDVSKGVIYPMYKEDGLNSQYDTDCPISIIDDEVSSDWWDSLSDEDYCICVNLGY